MAPPTTHGIQRWLLMLHPLCPLALPTQHGVMRRLLTLYQLHSLALPTTGGIQRWLLMIHPLAPPITGGIQRWILTLHPLAQPTTWQIEMIPNVPPTGPAHHRWHTEPAPNASYTESTDLTHRAIALSNIVQSGMARPALTSK